MTKPRPKPYVPILEAVRAYGPVSARQVVAKTGLNYKTVSNTLQRARLAGDVHVRSWKRNFGEGGRHAPIFVIGPGTDATKLVVNENADARRRAKEKRVEQQIENRSHNIWAGLLSRGTT